MKRCVAVVAAIVLLGAGSALAAVGGGEITLKNTGGDVVFSHETHVEVMVLACTECHAELYTNVKQHKTVTMQQMAKGKSCGACHDGKKAFSVKGDCAKCHTK